MKRIQDLRLTELLLVYVGLFGIYVVTPSSLTIVRQIVAPLMAVLIAVIFFNSLKYFRQR